MFKRTNKMWKVLALVLALCMLSTVAFAEGEELDNSAQIQELVVDYDEAEKTVAVSGTITKAGNDVTILAVRAGAAYEELDDEVWDTEKLQSEVVYIDQVTSNATTGAFEFNFVPRENVPGGVITVFVGGEEVALPAHDDFEAKEFAPMLVLPEEWYEGETTLAIELKKHNDETVAYTNAEAWEAAIDAVTVTPAKEGLTWELNSEKTHLVLSGFETTGESITKIVITTDGNVFYPAEWEDDALAQEAKDAGSLSFSGTAVAGTPAAITVTSEDADWKAALTTEGAVKVDNVAVTVSVEGNILYVPVDITDDTTDTKTVTVTVEKLYYVTEEVEVEVIAPTTDALNKFVAPIVDYSDSEYVTTDPLYNDGTNAATGTAWTAEELESLFGVASVTLPTSGLNETTYEWFDGDTPITEETFALTRALSNEQNPVTTKELTVKITKAGYKPEEKAVTLNVKQCGVSQSVDPQNVTIIKNDAYGLTGKTLISVVVPSDVLDPTAENMMIGEDKLYYSPVKGTYYGVVDTASAESANTVAAAVVFGSGASENIYFGVAVSGKTAQDASDFALRQRIYLRMTTEEDNAMIDAKVNLAFDVSDSEPDGDCDATDFSYSQQKYLRFIDEIPVNVTEVEAE